MPGKDIVSEDIVRKKHSTNAAITPEAKDEANKLRVLARKIAEFSSMSPEKMAEEVKEFIDENKSEFSFLGDINNNLIDDISNFMQMVWKSSDWGDDAKRQEFYDKIGIANSIYNYNKEIDWISTPTSDEEKSLFFYQRLLLNCGDVIFEKGYEAKVRENINADSNGNARTDDKLNKADLLLAARYFDSQDQRQENLSRRLKGRDRAGYYNFISLNDARKIAHKILNAEESTRGDIDELDLFFDKPEARRYYPIFLTIIEERIIGNISQEDRNEDNIKNVIDAFINIDDGGVLEVIEGFKVGVATKLQAVVRGNKVRFGQDGWKNMMALKIEDEDGSYSYKEEFWQSLNEALDPTSRKIVNKSNQEEFGKLKSYFHGFGENADEVELHNSNAALFFYSTSGNFEKDFEYSSNKFFEESSPDDLSVYETMACIPGAHAGDKQFVSLISFNGESGLNGSNAPTTPSVIKVFLGRDEAQKRIEQASTTQQEVCQYFAKLQAAEFAVNALMASYHQKVIDGENLEGDDMKALKEAINERVLYLRENGFSNRDQMPVLRAHMNKFKEYDISLKGDEIDALDAETKGVLDSLSDISNQGKITKESKIQADSVSKSLLAYEKSEQLTTSIVSNSFALLLNDEESKKLESRYTNAKAHKSSKDVDDFFKILRAPILCPISNGVVITKPQYEEAGYLELSGKKRKHSDGRATVANVVFAGDTKDNIAYIHIPNTDEMYYMAERAVKDGQMDVMQKNGKSKSVSVKKGQVIIHKCPFKKSGYSYNPIQITNMNNYDADRCKSFSVRAVSARDGKIEDIAMMFDGVSFSGIGHKKKSRVDIKGAISPSLNGRPLNFEIEPFEIQRLELIGNRNDVELSEDEKSYLGSARESSVLAKRMIEIDYPLDNLFKDESHFRIVMPLYGYNNSYNKTFDFIGGEPLIEVYTGVGTSKYEKLTPSAIEKYYKGDSEKYCEEVLKAAKEKKITVAIKDKSKDGKAEYHLLYRDPSKERVSEMKVEKIPNPKIQATSACRVGSVAKTNTKS